jgi:hypothetical protein
MQDPLASRQSGPPLPQSAERRAYARHPRRLDMLWQFLGLGREMASARVLDLSASGVGLVFDRPFPPDTLLLIRMPTATLGWTSHLVKVKHSRELGPGEFQTGCTFVRPLTPEQLQALLR